MNNCSYVKKEKKMNSIDKSVNIFKALGDNTRLRIVNELSESEANVNTLVVKLGMTQSAISHQLKILKLNGIIKSERKGKEVYYSLDDSHIETIVRTVIAHTSHEKHE